MNGRPPPAPPTPFKGLAPFDESDLDALLFFGREHDAEIIAANLVASRLTVLHGPSGVGKTSVLRAGVVHRLREDPRALTVVFGSWSGDPTHGMIEAIRAAAAAAGTVVEAAAQTDLAETLAKASTQLDRHVYVILDQFEEYFLYQSPTGPFVDELAEAIRRQQLRANFLLSIRDDALAHLDMLEPRVPRLFSNSLRLDRLDRRDGERAITGPIAAYNGLFADSGGIEIDPELVEAVLDEVAIGRVDLGHSGRGHVHGGASRNEIETPYLQLVLERLWSFEAAHGSARLSFATLQQLGGAERIVEEHVERSMSGLTATERDTAAEIYNHLVTPSGSKIAHRARDLAGYAAIPEPDVTRVLDQLSDERIVRAEEDGAAGPHYEIFHDVLAEAVLAWRMRHQAARELEAERALAARRHRRLLVASAFGAAVIAVLTAATVYALVQRTDAQAQARRAHAGELMARATTALSIDPVRSVELAARAARLQTSPQTEETLRNALRALRLDALFRMQAPVATARFADDGRLVVVAAGNAASVFEARNHHLVRALENGSPITGAWPQPNGGLVLITGVDGVARAWNLKTGRLVYLLHHGGRVNFARFSRDGRLVATASDDRTARIWRASDGKPLETLGHPRPVTSLAFDAGGTLLATAAGDGTARVFEVATGRLVSKVEQPRVITVVTFAPAAPILATAGTDIAARLWNGRTGELLQTLRGHQAPINDVEFDPAGYRVITASADQTARIWDARTGRLIAPIFATGAILRARFSQEGISVVTASSDGSARVYDATGALRSMLVGHHDAVTDAIFSPNGDEVLTASHDGTARLWRWRSSPYLHLVGRHAGRVTALAFSPDGRRLASAGSDAGMQIWSLRGGAVPAFVAPPLVTSASFAGDRVVVSNTDGVARLWLFDGRFVNRFEGPGGVSLAALAPDGQVVATAGADIRLWNAETGRLDETIRTPGRTTALAFSPDGRELVTGGADSVARLWRVSDGSLLHELHGHRGPVITALFSPDGRLVLTTAADRTARLWDAATGELGQVFRASGTRRPRVAFSPDGRLVVTTTNAREARLWDVATGRALPPVLRVRYAIITDVAFTADGRWVVASVGGGAVIFRTDTGRQLAFLRTGGGLPLAVATSPTGWRVGVGGSRGLVESYDCRLCGGLKQLLAIADARLAQLRARP